MICDHWFIMTIYIPLGILGSIPELAAPYFIGKTVDAFSLDDMNEVKKVITMWAMVIIAGALLGMIRDFLTNYAAEIFGQELR